MESGGSFRFTWKVKNFSFLWHREHQFLKWTFNVKRNITTSWSLLLYPSTPKKCVSCVLRKESGDPVNFLMDYEFSFLSQDGSSLHSIKVYGADFNSKSRSVLLWLHHDEIFENKSLLSLPEDALNICCKMWIPVNPLLEMVRYFAETEIKVERCSLTWEIVAFSGLKHGKKRDNFVIHPLTGNPCISLSLLLDHWNDFIFEIFVLVPKLVELFKCEVFLVDISGKKLKCGRFEVVTIGKTTDPDWKFHLSLTKRILMENEEQYLPNDTLTLQCEVAFSSGIEAEPVQKLELHCQNNQNIPCETKIANISTSPKFLSESAPQKSSINHDSENDFVYLVPKESNVSSFLIADSNSNLDNLNKYTKSLFSPLSWMDDLLILYENGTFCDAELLVASDCIPVHSLILSIRSPVFCDIFTRAKREGKKKTVCIDDLDAGTIRKMILFLYTDTLEDLEYKCAKGLYVASIKYEIMSLKGIVLSFLKQNLTAIHCCDILLLADKYKDEGLKQAVQYFISEHDEILNFDQWRSLEENCPHVTIETYRFMHQKLRKS